MTREDRIEMTYCFRVHISESVHAKIFMEFAGLIIRSRFYTCLKELFPERFLSIGSKESRLTDKQRAELTARFNREQQDSRGFLNFQGFRFYIDFHFIKIHLSYFQNSGDGTRQI